jgi:hypothetical protein
MRFLIALIICAAFASAVFAAEYGPGYRKKAQPRSDMLEIGRATKQGTVRDLYEIPKSYGPIIAIGEGLIHSTLFLEDDKGQIRNFILENVYPATIERNGEATAWPR